MKDDRFTTGFFKAATQGVIAVEAPLGENWGQVKNGLETTLFRQGKQLLQETDRGSASSDTIHLRPDGFWMRLSAGFDDLWLWQEGEKGYGYRFRFPTRAAYTALVALVLAIIFTMALFKGRPTAVSNPGTSLALIFIFWGVFWPWLAITSHKRRLRRLLERALAA